MLESQDAVTLMNLILSLKLYIGKIVGRGDFRIFALSGNGNFHRKLTLSSTSLFYVVLLVYCTESTCIVYLYGEDTRALTFDNFRLHGDGDFYK